MASNSLISVFPLVMYAESYLGLLRGALSRLDKGSSLTTEVSSVLLIVLFETVRLKTVCGDGSSSSEE